MGEPEHTDEHDNDDHSRTDYVAGLKRWPTSDDVLRRFGLLHGQVPDKTEPKLNTVLVTGANTGIGKATCIALSKAGAYVILACRNTEKGATALDEIEKSGGNAMLLQLDLGNLASILNAVSQCQFCFQSEIATAYSSLP